MLDLLQHFLNFDNKICCEIPAGHLTFSLLSGAANGIKTLKFRNRQQICFLTMANLKNDLDEYMLMNEERKSTGYKLNIKMPKLPSVFGGNSESNTSNNWLNDDESGWCPKMNRIQRMIATFVCFALGIFCLVVSTFYIPVLVFKARKFALLYSMASALFIAG